MENKHAAQKEKHESEDNKKKSYADKVQEDSNKKNKKNRNKDDVSIPCDLCDFKSISAEDFIDHIEKKHQKKSEHTNAKKYTCNRCDFVSSSEDSFKKHLEMAHRLNVGGFTKVSYTKPKQLCIQWNRGRCTYDQRCKYVHEQMTACTFGARCARMDCRFWHEESTGKFPFLGMGHRQPNPNFFPRRPFQSRRN